MEASSSKNERSRIAVVHTWNPSTCGEDGRWRRARTLEAVPPSWRKTQSSRPSVRPSVRVSTLLLLTLHQRWSSSPALVLTSWAQFLSCSAYCYRVVAQPTSEKRPNPKWQPLGCEPSKPLNPACLSFFMYKINSGFFRRHSWKLLTTHQSWARWASQWNTDPLWIESHWVEATAQKRKKCEVLYKLPLYQDTKILLILLLICFVVLDKPVSELVVFHLKIEAEPVCI